MYDQFKILNQLELPLNKGETITFLEQKEWIDGELTYWVELNKKAIVWLSILQVGPTRVYAWYNGSNRTLYRILLTLAT